MAKKTTKRPIELENENAELRQQLAIARYSKVADNVTRFLQSGTKWGAIAFGIYIAGDTIKPFAGKDTKADIDLKGDLYGHFYAELFDVDAVCWIVIAIFFALATGAITYGLRQRKLRKDAIEHLHRQRLEKELTVDPNRTSSQITERGETNPEDL